MANNITRIYPTYDEKLVKNTILYGNGGKLYFDEAFKNEATAEEVKNLFLKGLIIVVEGTYYLPVCLEVADSNVTVTVGTDTTFTATTPVEA